jgi:hypothetical protein
VIEAAVIGVAILAGIALCAWVIGVERRLALLEDAMRSPVAQATVEDRFRTLSD